MVPHWKQRPYGARCDGCGSVGPALGVAMRTVLADIMREGSNPDLRLDLFACHAGSGLTDRAKHRTHSVPRRFA